MESALNPAVAHRHPTRRPEPLLFLGRLENRTALTDPVQANIIASDPRTQTSGGRHQIGTLAGFKSESVAGFILELGGLCEVAGSQGCGIGAGDLT
jgi:hypothetical protein